ncbi:unnamed protein product, partial [Ixodes hexagonus]
MAEPRKGSTDTRILRGFSDALDLRPISFSKPPPPHLICGLCGVVSMKPVLPGCRHFYCNLCYQLAICEDPPNCPRDSAAIYTGGFATTCSLNMGTIVSEYGVRCP